ncbi:hypothetical protein [Sphingomonas sp. STIS6.2]|uniref:hypothetical protein n=1 Tax=Sphingomonas sp. STIS6.2 TaxID=1379700 RepID=UPI0004DB5138|nr:hypothetical protein [Sphingomonas sp. STIS6.2]
MLRHLVGDEAELTVTVSDMALQLADDVRDAAMMLVAAAGDARTTAFGTEGAQELLSFANSYCTVVTANDELRRAQRNGQ